MSEQEKDIEKIRNFIKVNTKGKFNHPEYEQIIINFIKLMTDDTEKQ